MDDSLRIRLVGAGLQLTLLGGFAAFAFGEIGVTLIVFGTIVTGAGIV